MTYNVTSYHMLIKVEFDFTPNIKVKLDILNLVMQLEYISSHKQ